MAEQPAADDGDPPSSPRPRPSLSRWPVRKAMTPGLSMPSTASRIGWEPARENAAIEGVRIAARERCRASPASTEPRDLRRRAGRRSALTRGAASGDILIRRIARKQRRQQHPVVGRTRSAPTTVTAKPPDRAFRRRSRKRTLRHAVADDEQPSRAVSFHPWAQAAIAGALWRAERNSSTAARQRVYGRIIDEVEPATRPSKLHVENLADRGGRPFVIITMRSESSTASSTSCVIMIVVLPSRAWISMTESCRCARVSASSGRRTARRGAGFSAPSPAPGRCRRAASCRPRSRRAACPMRGSCERARDCGDPSVPLGPRLRAAEEICHRQRHVLIRR